MITKKSRITPTQTTLLPMALEVYPANQHNLHLLSFVVFFACCYLSSVNVSSRTAVMVRIVSVKLWNKYEEESPYTNV